MLALVTILSLSSLCVAMPLRVEHPALNQSGQVPEKKVTGPDHLNCKRRGKSKGTIIGGTVVRTPNEFPFLAWLGDEDGTGLSQYCGGTLIADKFVLTAGHCLYNEDWKNAKAYARVRLANFGTTPGLARRIVGWKRHPNYDTVTMFEDLAVLMLNESLPVNPVKLSDGAQAYEKSGHKTIVGWGSTDERCGQYDTMLRKATVPMGNYGRECKTEGSWTLTPAHDFDTDRQVCAGDYRGRKHYPGCGDSGGPLLAREGRDWVQVGLVSWSYGIPYPDVFTRVSKYLSWINSTMAELRQANTQPAVGVP